MAVNKRIAKKRAKMAAEKETKAAAKTVVEVKAKEIPIVKIEPVVEEVPVVETAPVVEVTPVVEDKKEEAAEKKPAVRKPRKRAVKVNLVVQAAGKEVTMDEAIARVKEAWVAEGNSEKDLKELAVYAKPEEQAIYYVVNGTVTGKIAF